MNRSTVKHAILCLPQFFIYLFLIRLEYHVRYSIFNYKRFV